MRGVFTQNPSQPHIALRSQLLAADRQLDGPPVTGDATSADLPALAELMLAQLAGHGVAVVRLDEPLGTEEFRELGTVLGTAQPELAPTVQPFVESEVVLNLITSSPATLDADLQPFAANWLSLHTESSGAPVPVQPRYIVLMCVTPGDDPRCARTVLVPMAGIFAQLSAADRELFQALRYDRGEPPTILRIEDGRPVFSLRDFQEDPLTWVYDGPDADPDTVNDALTRLYAAVYSSPAVGVRWQRGLLVVIDNHVHFHGRTAGVAAPPGATRHLKRLRIAEGPS